jgi:hypothetical protein
MGSLTKQMKTIAKNKLKKSGKIRKRKSAAASTPKFDVHADPKEPQLPQPAGAAADEA